MYQNKNISDVVIALHINPDDYVSKAINSILGESGTLMISLCKSKQLQSEVAALRAEQEDDTLQPPHY